MTRFLAPTLNVSGSHREGLQSVVVVAYGAVPEALTPSFVPGAPTSQYAEQAEPRYTPFANITSFSYDQPGGATTHRKKLLDLDAVRDRSISSKTGKPTSPKKVMVTSGPMPAKSRRVRTGCLTCRERHLKCDEGTPDCLNCRKSNRECKRGVRLNFIDMTCKQPPYIPPAEEWSVQFQDESRLIASEYQGGLQRYGRLTPQTVTPPRETGSDSAVHVRSSHMLSSLNTQAPDEHRTPVTLPTPQSMYYPDRTHLSKEPFSDEMQRQKSSNSSLRSLQSAAPTAEYGNIVSNSFLLTKGENVQASVHDQYVQDSPITNAAGFLGVDDVDDSGEFNSQELEGISRFTKDAGGQMEYLNSPEELYFMQVFVSDVGIWMDCLDKEKHFSRVLPYYALKSPMLLNALLACGVKHLTLTEEYSEEKALFYYDTATRYLLRSLRNPDRNTVECATTAVVLNVYEIMSERPTQRMSHIAGARALIRECGWNAKSSGLGAACFWLNVGMELLSCLAFNWQTSWDPDHWGVNTDMKTDRIHGREEVWVHRIFHIVAKIANFRASIPKFQGLDPHGEQVRHQQRCEDWKKLKDMCDNWNAACPRSMHPFAYLHPSQSRDSQGKNKSLFPNIWLIKRAAVVGRLYYHMAQCLLQQINPASRKDSPESRAGALYHAHQVCGIVAHTKDRGVSSISIRSIVIVSEALTDSMEQDEVISILQTTERDTGWKLAGVIQNLKRRWGAEKTNAASLAAHFLNSAPLVQGKQSEAQHGQDQNRAGPGGIGTASSAIPGGNTLPDMDRMQQQQQPQPVAAPQPIRNMSVNPLSFADFSLPNHPYQDWYEPPSRSNSYGASQGLF
ncbi:hypothetical protein BX600DRAFT_441462 [Xylariales sp. PMI_506]|nr:hypothetical protein BX600DRAFT_441462 [Xylariales sp. PMI_506]